MKRLHRLVLKSFLGPFVMTFFIVMFLLLMQFLWRYIDELVGKGLQARVIAELLVYASSSLVPLALPLSVLLSSLMTFGNLGEYSELTALKSSGVSLRRIIMPVVLLTVLLTVFALFFSNNVLPVTNLKMKSLLYDVRQQRPEFQITEGVFYNGIDNFSIRVSRKDPSTSMLYDIKIYDHTERRGNVSVTVADSGHMEITADRRNLVITLWSGYTYSELESDRRARQENYPHRTVRFREERMVIEMAGFELNRSDGAIFRNSYQMLNLSQLSHARDSLRQDLLAQTTSYFESLYRNNFFALKSDGQNKPLNMLASVTNPFGMETMRGSSSSFTKPVPEPVVENPPPDTSRSSYDILKISNFDELLKSFPLTDRYMIVDIASQNASSTMNYVISAATTISYDTKYLRRHEIEWHRKFTLSFACLIFLFIGAPLGAIIRKGGLGLPTVISTLLFILYYVISLTGEKFVRESVISSFMGMWLSAFILIGAGIFLTYKATNDAAMLNLETYYNWFRSFLGIGRSSMLQRKEHLAGKFDYLEMEREQLQEEFRFIADLARECWERMRNDVSPSLLLKNAMSNRNYPYLLEFGIHYSSLFDQVVLSRWYRIPYFRKRLSEFPYTNYRTSRRYFDNKAFRLISLIIFPIFLFRYFQLLISVTKHRRNLLLIADLSSGMINLLNSSAMKTEMWQ